MTQFVSKYMYDISLWNFLKLEKHQQVAYLVGVKGHFDFLLHGLPISFKYTFPRCVAYFFLQQGPQISSTSNKVMLSVPNGEGAPPPPSLDCRPFSYLRASLLEPPGGQEHAWEMPASGHPPVSGSCSTRRSLCFCRHEWEPQAAAGGPYIRAVHASAS